MMISTKGRYALRFMADLAQHRNGGYIPLKDVADRQDISLKYLERIALLLTTGGLLDSVHGKGGGYRLTKAPEDYTALEILELTEGTVAPVECLTCSAEPCKRAAICPTLGLWKGFYDKTKEYFSSVTLRDLAMEQDQQDYVI